MTHDNGNTNEICTVCERLLPLCPLATIGQNRRVVWVLGHYCGACQRWGARLPGTWPTEGEAVTALAEMRL